MHYYSVDGKRCCIPAVRDAYLLKTQPGRAVHPPGQKEAMKKLFTLCTIVCMCLCCACVTAPQPKKATTAEDFYNKALDLFNRRNYFDAIPAFEKVREKFPLSPFAVLSELRLGESHYRKEEYTEALHFFENFRRMHPSNQHVPYSILMTGMCNFAQVLSVDRDQTFAEEAVEQFRLLIDLYPTSPYTGKALCKMSEALEHIAGHEVFVGHFYLKKGNYQGAVERFTKVLKQYPHSIKKDEVLYSLADSLILAGKKPKGRRVLNMLIRRFPSSPYAKQAKSLLRRNGFSVPS